MTPFFDTSYLFRMYSGEPGHQEVKALLSGCERIVSSWHAWAEFASIVLRKKRETGFDPEAFDELHRQFLDEYESGHIQLLSIGLPVMQRLESVLKSAPPDTFLRAADALHLACAAEHGFAEVYSNDRQLLEAAPLFGLKGRNVIL